MTEIDLTISEIDALINDRTTYENIIQSKNQAEKLNTTKEPDDFLLEKQ